MSKKNKAATKCTCGQRHIEYCKRCSDLRMVIALKNNQDHLKLSRADGSLANPVWYSFLGWNGKPTQYIIDKMEEAVRGNPKFGATANVLLFYINGQRQQHIKKIIL